MANKQNVIGMNQLEFSQTVHTLRRICDEAIDLLNAGYKIGVNNLNVREYDRLGAALQDMVESLDMDRAQRQNVHPNV